MNTVKYVRVQQSDGSYTQNVPIGAQAQNVILQDGTNVQNKLGTFGNDLNAMSNRFDQIATLVDGSTTGDAELIDIRNDAFGNTHANAGTSVREQAKKITRAEAFLNDQQILQIHNYKLVDDTQDNYDISQAVQSWMTGHPQVVNQIGTPLKASTAAAMTDTSRIYVYTGSQSGYTNGNWYYYNNGAWISGGIYNSVAVETDTTLSVTGSPADAKVVGDEFIDIKNVINSFYSSNSNNSIIWGRGGLNSSTGGTSNANANKRCRTVEVLIDGQAIVCDSFARFYIYFYNGPASTDTYVGNSGAWLHGCDIADYASKHYPTADRFKLVGSMADDSDIGDGSSADITECTDHIFILEKYGTEEDVNSKYGFVKLLTSDDDLADINECGAYRWTTASVPNNSPTSVGGIMFVYGTVTKSFTGKAGLIINYSGNLFTNVSLSDGWLSNWVFHKVIDVDDTLSVSGDAADSKAVGDEFSNAYKRISYSEKIINEQLIDESPSFSWAQGNINSTTGGASNSTNRVRTVGDSENGKIITKNGISVTVPSGLKIFAHKYLNDTLTEGYDGNDGVWFESGVHYFNDVPYYRFVAARSDDADLVPADASGIIISRKVFTDKTLTMSNMAADSKAVNDEFTDVRNIINSFYSANANDDVVWERGSLNSSTGGTSNANANKRCRMAEVMIDGQTVICDGSVRFYVYFYNGPASSTTYSGNSGAWLHVCNIESFISEHNITADRFKLVGSMIDDSNIGDGQSADVTGCTSHIFVLEKYGTKTNKYGFMKLLTRDDDLADINECGAYRWATSSVPANSPTSVGGVLFVYGATNTSFAGKAGLIINYSGNLFTNVSLSDGWLSDWVFHKVIELDDTLSVSGDAADGKAVGDEFDAAYERMSRSEKIIDEQLIDEQPSFSLQQGNINSSTGMPSSTNADFRLRTVGDSDNNKIITKNGIMVTVPDGLKIFAHKYSNDTVTEGYAGNNGKWFENGEYYFNDAPYYRFVIAFSDESAIVPADASGITISRKSFTDKTLTMSNMAADAKMVGERFSSEVESISARFDLTNGQTEEYDISQYPLHTLSINADNVWYSSTLRHSIIPIDDGIRIIRIDASTGNAVIAFLTDSTVVEGATPAFASGESGRRVLTNGESSYYLVPDDAEYLFVYRGYSGNAYANTPSNIIGYKMSLSIDCIRAAVAHSGEPYGLVRDVPKNQGVRNAYKKMHQLLDVRYVIPAEIPSRSDTSAGIYTGVIYSGTADKAHYVGWNVSMLSFVTALHNPYSGMYTEGTEEDDSFSAYGVTYHGTNSNTPLGVVCAPFVAYALGMDIKWENHAWPYLESIGVLEKIADQSYTGVELGDTIYKRGHVAIVSDIYRNSRGEPRLIYVSESWSPRAKTTIYTAESFTAYMEDGVRTIYRYKDLYKNLDYQQSAFVAVDGETPSEPYVFNDDICPYLGDYSVYREGELIAICYTKGSYTKMIISKDGTDVQTISLPSSSDVHHINLSSYNLTAGSYTARLSNSSNVDSEPAHFSVASFPIGVSENGDSITVTFDPNKDPRYVQICSLAGAARCVVPLSDSDKALGTKTFNIRTEITTQNSSVPSGTACYATVVYGITDPAGYRLVRSSEFVPLNWID